MKMDIWHLYEMMLRSRLFEERVIAIWTSGKISGEMHLGIGEEAICAGVIDHLEEGDAMALDHRGTPPMIMRGVDPVSLLKEFMGKEDGLCGGMGGHMHLFSKEKLIASSGILGSSGPAASGFALTFQYRKKENVALAFFGEGTMNQGMLMESMNLAVAWNLPVIFICKDNRMALLTVSSSVTGGSLPDRAASFGMPAYEIDGNDVETVWSVAGQAVMDARSGKGPSYLHAHCFRREGHFLGDPLLRISRNPVVELSHVSGSLFKSVIKREGSSLSDRARNLKSVFSILGKTAKDQVIRPQDPVESTREKLQTDQQRLKQLEDTIRREMDQVMITCAETGPER